MSNSINAGMSGTEREGAQLSGGLAAADGRAAQWQSQLQQIEVLYPGLDIRAGIGKPQLKQLLKAGVDFKTAFEAANIEDIKAYAAMQAEKRLISRLQERAGGVKENGISSSGSGGYPAGASGLSEDDRENIVRRVLKGEEIRL